MSTTTNVRTSVTDAGYIAVGLGVLGYEQVRELVGQIVERANTARDRARTEAKAQARVASDRATEARERAAKAVEESRTRVRGLIKRAA